MLRNNFTFNRECCPTLVTKRQIMDVKIENNMQQESSLNQIQPGSAAIIHNGYGKLFTNEYRQWCLWAPCICATHASEIEFENERMTLVNLPNCCACYGPWPVEDKQFKKIGELRPECYCCKMFWWTFFHPCCMKLHVHDSNLNEAYTINRVPCTCLCCAKWKVETLSH